MEKRRHQVVQETFAKLGYDRVNPEQMMAIKAYISGIDVFVTLPTWFGKSLIYDTLISPLFGLMQDQVQVFSSKGISSASILLHLKLSLYFIVVVTNILQ